MNDNIDKLLEERGKQYGSFPRQVQVITRIMNELRFVRNETSKRITAEDVENFFLVLKLVRSQTATDPDSYDDLCGYAKLIRQRRFGDDLEVD